jgi:hypothetical protein
MRSFLRYAQYRGEVATALAAAVPIVAAWATAPALPKAYHPSMLSVRSTVVTSVRGSACAIAPCCCS